MRLTYVLGLIVDYDAETAGAIANRVWAALERDTPMAKKVRRAAAVEASNADRIEEAFREVTSLPLLPNPVAYLQGFALGVVAALVPKDRIAAVFDSGVLDQAVEIYWGFKRDYGDPRGRDLAQALIDSHKAEFALFKTRRHLKRVA